MVGKFRILKLHCFLMLCQNEMKINNPIKSPKGLFKRLSSHIYGVFFEKTGPGHIDYIKCF